MVTDPDITSSTSHKPITILLLLNIQVGGRAEAKRGMLIDCELLGEKKREKGSMLSLRKVVARWKVVTWKTYTEEQNYNSRETNFEKNDAFKFIQCCDGRVQG